ncbi:MAG: YibE/F family protein [Spirochaetales bacterium]|nr:YibE/F family protein [Spirochaetales bacterium]
MKPVGAIAGAYFRHAFENFNRKEAVFVAVILILSVILVVLPDRYSNPLHLSSERVKARIIETDDSGVGQFGMVKQGEQYVTALVLEGTYRGQMIEAVNLLLGKMDLDKLFRPGDVALAVIDPGPDPLTASHATLMDYYRIDLQLAMVLLFFVLLLLYGGWTGIKTFVAFGFTVLAVWKILIPVFLAGISPLFASFLVITLLTIVIVFLIAGLNRVGISAVLGTLSGIAACVGVVTAFSGPYHLNGAVRPFTETLLYTGYGHLNLTHIFMAGTVLASSGAIMDLAMDIAAAMGEVHHKRPELGFRELVSSGFRVGRTVFGTMTTTLLLAYTGGFTSLLMVFMAQGIPLISLFNMNYLSSEVFHTLMGSFGLVLVAPFTALISAAVFTKDRGKNQEPADEAPTEPAIMSVHTRT